MARIRNVTSIMATLALAAGGLLPAIATGQSPSPGASVLTLAVSDPAERPSQASVDAFVEQVAVLSDGALTIQPVFDAGSQTEEGFEAGVAGMMLRDEADLGLVASRAWDLAGVTSLQALQAPFLITSDALAAAVAQSDVATRALEGMADAGLTGLALWPEDLRHPFSFVPDHPLLAPEDFGGRTILVQPSALSRELVATLGADLFADDMDRGEAVEAGLLHGAESGLLQGQSLPGTPTATGNVTFYPKFQVLVAATSAFDSLTDEQREVLRAAAAATQRMAIENHPAEADAGAAWCEAGGAVVFATDEQIEAFEDAAQPILDRIAQDPLGAELVTDIQALRETTDPSPGAVPCEPTAEASLGPTGSVAPDASPSITATAGLDLVAIWDPSVIPGLSSPSGMDLSPEGELYVVNGGSDEILVLDADGTVLRRWGESGTGVGQFTFARPGIDPAGGVAVGPDGAVYVVDTSNDRVQVFDPDGRYVRGWGSTGRDDGEFTYPWDVAVAPDGTVYVVDAERNDVQRFTADGAHLETIGSPGSEDGELMDTSSVFVDRAGNLYNADWRNNRVQAWDEHGAFLWSLGGPGGGQPSFRTPNDVGVDDSGNLYVTEQRNLHVFDPAHELIASWTTPGTTPNDEIYAVVVAPDGSIYVNLIYNHTIYKLAARVD